MKRSMMIGTLVLSLTATGSVAQGMPFGSEDDVDMIRATPYEGTDPHGMMLETFYTTAELDGHEGDLIVKRNFGPEGVTEDEVLRNPDEHLAAYTVMFRRAAGYDPENADWYWVKYLPDGALDQTPDGVAMAGQVAKGMDEGCIACHQSAGEDMVFTSDHLAD